MKQDELMVTVAGVVRPMNEDEYAQYEADQAEFAAIKQAITEQTAAKAALLTKLGITADEAALLLGAN